jgi:hypothetical protein
MEYRLTVPQPVRTIMKAIPAKRPSTERKDRVRRFFIRVSIVSSGFL